MRKYYLLTLTSIILLPIFILAWINNGVSKKYETEIGECISETSGQNLCVIGFVLTVGIFLLGSSFFYGIFKVLKLYN